MNTWFLHSFENKFLDFFQTYPDFFQTKILEWPTQVKYRHCNMKHDKSKIILILNKIYI